ncbi:carbohydrate kinase family protein [Planococcus sp. 1R117A]|uniref:carbohydrate kinase family protein n=1 Tax=Planococcus sp. 1R117A TaxID=3447020 RepID=UPI003EDBB9A8
MNKKEQEVIALIKKNPYLSQQEMADSLKMSRPSLANLISGLIRQGKIAGRAYILPEEGTVVCIGGANVDRKFWLDKAAQMGTSNPASVSVSIGGVARNVAENLGRMGHRVKLMSIAGNDQEWKLIEENSSPFMDTDLTITHNEFSTGTYTAILEPDGEMILAMADMAIYDSLTVDYVKRNEPALLTAAFLVIDLNCPKETVQYVRELAKARDIPLAVIPVSTPKIDRLEKDLSGITWLILNRGEAERFLDITIDSEETWQDAITRLLEHGAENVVITGGKDGAMAGNREQVSQFAAISVPELLDVTGAGDAFSSGIIHSYLKGHPFEKIIQTGLVNAAKTLQSEATVRTELSAMQLQNELEELI